MSNSVLTSHRLIFVYRVYILDVCASSVVRTNQGYDAGGNQNSFAQKKIIF